MKKTVWIINQYGSTPATGVGGRHYYMAREMAKQGHKVYVIASASHHILRTKPAFGEDVFFEEVDGVRFVWIKMPHYEDAHSKQRVLNWFLFSWRLKKLTKLINDKPDAILSSSPSLFSFIGAKRLARKTKARLVFEVRDIWPLTLTEIGGFSVRHPFVRLMQWVENKAYHDSDAVISNLKNSVEHMIEHGMNPEKFTWVPNGFSFDEVSQKTPLNEHTASQIPKGKFIVGYAGTLGVANSLDTLIIAAEQLKEYTNIAFVLVGDGKEKTALQAIVKEKKLTNIYFIEPIPKVEIQALLSQFDSCFIGWLNDGLYRFGIAANKIFDYLYSGKPVIHAYSGECDPITEAQAGLQVPAENPQQLADAVLQLYQMPVAQRETMGTNGRKTALEHYEYGQLAEKLACVLFKS